MFLYFLISVSQNNQHNNPNLTIYWYNHDAKDLAM